MAPKMGQPMEFFKGSLLIFYEMSGNTHFLETLNPYFHCENWLFQLKFSRVYPYLVLSTYQYLPGSFYL